MTLADLKVGQTARILSVAGEGSLRQHFLDMGVIPGTKITLVKLAPMGDPMQLRIHSYNLTLRLDDARLIGVELCEPQDEIKQPKDSHIHTKHPGYGEFYTKHPKMTPEKRKSSQKITFALAGNQNCGKTTLFNQLTGSKQHVGNFPGVTVDRKSGTIKGHPNAEIIDLPGIYSMSPYSKEEIVTRRFILDEKPTAIINIVDATNIERNLYLTMQLMELGIPMVLALNMMDEVRGNGGSILINRIEAMLGMPVVPISASKNEGVDELVDHAIHVAEFSEPPEEIDFCDSGDNGGAVHRCIHSIIHLIYDHAERAGIPIRFAATKLIEGDELVKEALQLDDNELEAVEHIISQMEQERGVDRAVAIADMRFSFIEKVVENTVVQPGESKEHRRSRKMDRILTGRFTALPIFALIMAAIFFCTFYLIGGNLQNLLDMGITSLIDLANEAFEAWNVNEIVRSLVVDGVFAGIGSVLSFLPVILTLFFFLSLLEDTGYMARIAFVMDRPLRKLGLSGRSIVPLLIGFGCSVPSIMASRTMPSERDRRMTILLVPFMSCSAKLPIYSFFCSLYFGAWSWLVMLGLYFLGILVGIAAAVVMKKTIFKGEAVPFVMELPNYRIPGVKNVGHLLWDKAKDFLVKAFTVIFIASIVIWFLQTFSPTMNMVDDSSDSILAIIAGFIAPIFVPLGFGYWQYSTAIISGFMAKESVVATIMVLFTEGEAGILNTLTPLAALSFLVFCLLYTPCVATIAAVKRELGWGWAGGVVLFQCCVAWIFAFAVYGIGTLVGL